MDEKTEYILQLKHAYETIKALNEQYGERYQHALIEADHALKQALSYEFGIRGEHGTCSFLDRLH
ncbi:hypothetical protein [Fictibacillus terranigra]|uniref:Uncharacterized protein n=1 Tax=Fictibacillus terranigra TaxID=3058424 RepID=A0ABT8E998_9BACL|nr:hypothetical protein [Fictibacillus sp. CENA-BCM004]MDN4074484.1 hypothetical protein [Fictibacillus sp. CENA-BCM004]